MLNPPLPEWDNYTALAGYIIDLADRMPRRNEVFEDGDYRFTLLRVHKWQIQDVKVEQLLKQ